MTELHCDRSASTSIFQRSVGADRRSNSESPGDVTSAVDTEHHGGTLPLGARERQPEAVLAARSLGVVEPNAPDAAWQRLEDATPAPGNRLNRRTSSTFPAC